MLLIVSPSGSCELCSGVLLPALPPPHCSLYHHCVAATIMAGATGLCLHNLIGEKRRKKENPQLTIDQTLTACVGAPSCVAARPHGMDKGA